MSNEGRWTDNGQPLTPAEGRTVMPMMNQVEQAIVARLLPSQAVEHAGAGAADAGAAANAGAGAGAVEVSKRGHVALCVRWCR